MTENPWLRHKEIDEGLRFPQEGIREPRMLCERCGNDDVLRLAKDQKTWICRRCETTERRQPPPLSRIGTIKRNT